MQAVNGGIFIRIGLALYRQWPCLHAVKRYGERSPVGAYQCAGWQSFLVGAIQSPIPQVCGPGFDAAGDGVADIVVRLEQNRPSNAAAEKFGAKIVPRCTGMALGGRRIARVDGF